MYACVFCVRVWSGNVTRWGREGWLENRGFLDRFNPSRRNMIVTFKYQKYKKHRVFQMSFILHSPITDLAVAGSEDVVQSVFVRKLKMQGRFWFLRSDRKSQKRLTFQSCYVLDTINKSSVKMQYKYTFIIMYQRCLLSNATSCLVTYKYSNMWL